MLPASAPDTPVDRGALPAQALFIKKCWCREILEHGKTWEIRGEPCHKRGRVCIAQSRSNLLVGAFTIVDCVLVARRNPAGDLVPRDATPAGAADFLCNAANFDKHRISDFSIVSYSKVFAWVLADVESYSTPIPWYPGNRRGSVKFVNLTPEVLRSKQTVDKAHGDSSVAAERVRKRPAAAPAEVLPVERRQRLRPRWRAGVLRPCTLQSSAFF